MRLAVQPKDVRLVAVRPAAPDVLVADDGPVLDHVDECHGVTSTDPEVVLEPVHDLPGFGVSPVPAFGSQLDCVWELIFGKPGFDWPNSGIKPLKPDDQLGFVTLRACSAETSSQLTSSTERPPSMVISSSRTA